MADWKDDYRQGSFRGVEFFTLSHEFQSGRRNVDHEFPSKEEGNSEDLGKRLPRFTLNIYVLGDNYFDLRNELIEALDREGPGELVHPYLGTKDVQVGGYSLTETVDEGRIARFTVEFITAGTPKFPEENIDPAEAVEAAALAALDAAQAALEAGMSVANSPARVATAAADLVDDATDRIDAVLDTVGTGAQAVADVAFAIRNIKADAAALVVAPDQLAARFRDAFELLFDAVEDFKAFARSISEEVSSTRYDPVIGGETAVKARLEGNQLAFQNFLVDVAIASQARAAIRGNFISVNEALDIKALLFSDIDAQIGNITDDDEFQRMKDLQVEIDRGLPPVDVGEIITFTPMDVLPVLVIAHKLFGNIDRESEIIEQNDIRHSGFAPLGVPIEVSSGD